MRWIYISPHFDDAVFSCGGLVWEQTGSGMPVEIWTICAGDAPKGPLSDLAAEIHARSNLGTAAQTISLRRVEDRNAARYLGAESHHFAFPDCIYRRSKKGEPLYTDIFGPINPTEINLVDDIAKMLAARLKPQDTIVCPLSIGNHVDHVLVRTAVEKLQRPLLYYADIPYLIDNPQQLDGKVDGLLATTFSVTEDGLRAWQTGSAAYASQISVLFSDLESMRKAIRQYWKRERGLCLWQAD
jgi:LmbE family N-acetylglucosaminyl deacetylase